ncbi:MAG: hypothetical protein QM690_16025 [Sphingobium sp.]
MTKVRAPLSFGLAITRIAGLIGWKEAARLARRSPRTIRHWSDSEKKGTPTLEQAIALDAAYIAAGGEGAPILSAYAMQIDAALAMALACRTALVHDIAAATRETADAIAHSIQAAQPGSTPQAVYRAIAETEEGVGALHRVLARLKSFLPGNGAGMERAGI